MHPIHRADILVKPLHDETILCDAGGNAIHVLNPTAAAIWDLCDGRHTLADITAALYATYAVDPAADVAGDVERIVAELLAKGLVEP